jgi:hypothetical protein
MTKCRTEVLGRHIQITTQRLGELERKILKTDALIDIALLHRERIQFGVDATARGKHSVEKPDFVLLALVALTAVFLGHAIINLGDL